MADLIEEREGDFLTDLAALRALPSTKRPTLAFLDRVARRQADWVSVAKGLETANAERERLYAKYPDERPKPPEE